MSVIIPVAPCATASGLLSRVGEVCSLGRRKACGPSAKQGHNLAANVDSRVVVVLELRSCDPKSHKNDGSFDADILIERAAEHDVIFTIRQFLFALLVHQRERTLLWCEFDFAQGNRREPGVVGARWLQTHAFQLRSSIMGCDLVATVAGARPSSKLSLRKRTCARIASGRMAFIAGSARTTLFR